MEKKSRAEYMSKRNREDIINFVRWRDSLYKKELDEESKESGKQRYEIYLRRNGGKINLYKEACFCDEEYYRKFSDYKEKIKKSISRFKF